MTNPIRVGMVHRRSSLSRRGTPISRRPNTDGDRVSPWLWVVVGVGAAAPVIVICLILLTPASDVTTDVGKVPEPETSQRDEEGVAQASLSATEGPAAQISNPQVYESGIVALPLPVAEMETEAEPSEGSEAIHTVPPKPGPPRDVALIIHPEFGIEGPMTIVGFLSRLAESGIKAESSAEVRQPYTPAKLHSEFGPPDRIRENVVDYETSRGSPIPNEVRYRGHDYGCITALEKDGKIVKLRVGPVEKDFVEMVGKRRW